MMVILSILPYGRCTHEGGSIAAVAKETTVLMKRCLFALLACALCLTVPVGCAEQLPGATIESTTTTAYTPVEIPDPTPPTPVGEVGKAFVGTWSVQAIKSTIAKLELHETGSAVMYTAQGQSLGGRFEVQDETTMTLTFSSTTLTGTYTIEGNTITITFDNDDVMILTKVTE